MNSSIHRADLIPCFMLTPLQQAHENALRRKDFERRRALEQAPEAPPEQAAPADWRDLDLAHPAVRHRIVTVTENGGGEETEFMRDEVTTCTESMQLRSSCHGCAASCS